MAHCCGRSTLAAPTVSVCIASYNHARYLRMCLDSVLAQTLTGLEVIIVDDGSSDGSLAIATEYAARHSRVRVFQHPGGENRGISASWNLAISKSRGEYLAWIGSDDVWYPQMLVIQAKALDRNRRAAFVYGRAHVIDAEGKRIGRPAIGREVTDPIDPIVRMIDGDAQVPALTVVARTQCVRHVGGFDDSLVYGDWEMWIRLMALWPIVFVNKPLAMYRIHGSNTCIDCPLEIGVPRQLRVMEALMERASTLGGALAKPRVRAMVYLQAAFYSFQLGDLEKAGSYTTECMRLDPSLFEETRNLSSWLRRSPGPAEAMSQSRAGEKGFGRWLMAHLVKLTRKPVNSVLAEEVAAAECIEEVALLVQKKRFAIARAKALHTLRVHPSWVLGRYRRKAMIRALLGQS